MKIGLLEIKNRALQVFSEKSILPALRNAGVEVTHRLVLADDHKGLVAAIDYLFNNTTSLLLYGGSQLKNAVSELTGILPENIGQIMAVADRDIMFVPQNADADYVATVLVPALNIKLRTLYSSESFRTFGISEDRLKDLLKEQIKNRNKIVVSVEGELIDCEVSVRYSNKMGKITVDELIAAVTDKIKPYVYSVDGCNLYEKTISLLKLRGKRLAVAESFTGGSVLAKLVSFDGASEFLADGVVPYSVQAKAARLGIDASLIEERGAVSADVAYEMAAGLLQHAELALATTGYAGSAPAGKSGLCYIAVGDINGIHVYEHIFEGTRAEVVEYGTSSAFYYLMKLLSGEQNPENIFLT